MRVRAEMDFRQEAENIDRFQRVFARRAAGAGAAGLRPLHAPARPGHGVLSRHQDRSAARALRVGPPVVQAGHGDAHRRLPAHDDGRRLHARRSPSREPPGPGRRHAGPAGLGRRARGAQVDARVDPERRAGAGARGHRRRHQRDVPARHDQRRGVARGDPGGRHRDPAHRRAGARPRTGSAIVEELRLASCSTRSTRGRSSCRRSWSTSSGRPRSSRGVAFHYDAELRRAHVHPRRGPEAPGRAAHVHGPAAGADRAELRRRGADAPSAPSGTWSPGPSGRSSACGCTRATSSRRSGSSISRRGGSCSASSPPRPRSSRRSCSSRSATGGCWASGCSLALVMFVVVLFLPTHLLENPLRHARGIRRDEWR